MQSFQVLPQSAICEFNFYANGAIYRGASAANGLYKLVGEYSLDQRIQASDCAGKLIRQGYRCILSAGLTGQRKVWVEVRSLINSAPLVCLDPDS